MRTIRVTGKGSLKVRPDMTRVTVTLTKLEKEYADALERSAKDTEKLKDLLSGFGFARGDVKTLSFGVDAEYESFRENNEYKQRLVGYRYRHSVKVEFDSDNERLGKVLYALAHSVLTPEIDVCYTVRDREAAKNELLGKAVADAAEKALVLTRAAGLTLKEIQSVDYSLSEPDMTVRPMGRMLMAKETASENSYHLDMEPDDVSLSDSVTVVWEIG